MMSSFPKTRLLLFFALSLLLAVRSAVAAEQRSIAILSVNQHRSRPINSAAPLHPALSLDFCKPRNPATTASPRNICK